MNDLNDTTDFAKATAARQQRAAETFDYCCAPLHAAQLESAARCMALDVDAGACGVTRSAIDFALTKCGKDWPDLKARAAEIRAEREGAAR